MAVVMRDTDVEMKGGQLAGKHILLGVSGGIAAVDTVRLCRELRRYGAKVSVVMTQSAQKVITPLAVKWSSQGDVISDWDSDLTVLSQVDAIIVSPATRNILASHLHGLMNGPLLMAMSAARKRNTPILLVPSMHNDLAEDPVTDDLVQEIQKQGAKVIWGEHEEGKRKTPPSEHIVAELCNLVNKNKTSVVITLGANRSAMDDIRFLQNTSSGHTGFAIADYLHRWGMDITCVSGITSEHAPTWLPLVIKSPDPEEMLDELIALSNDDINAWVHTAAVLDYQIEKAAEGKVASQQSGLQLNLVETRKHIMELAPLCKGACRIGFKLESGIKQKDLVHRAVAQNEKAQMTATIANRLEDMGDSEMPRAHLVDATGAHFVLQTENDMCEAIRVLIERGV